MKGRKSLPRLKLVAPQFWFIKFVLLKLNVFPFNSSEAVLAVSLVETVRLYIVIFGEGKGIQTQLHH